MVSPLIYNLEQENCNMEILSDERVKSIIENIKKKGFTIFETPYKLNIVGVRSSSVIPNKFDDYIYVFYKTNDGLWEGRKYVATTDTGTYWLKYPKMQSGSALLKEGQYIDTWKKGLHGESNPYPALVQQKPVTVFRDYNKNNVLDFNGKEQTGLFGINIHRANPNVPSQNVDKWSAGCQVFQDPKDFQDFMSLVDKYKTANNGLYSYTLIDNRWNDFYT